MSDIKFTPLPPQDDGVLLNPNDIPIKPYVVGTVACEISVYDLKVLGLFLQSLSDTKLNTDQDFLRSLVFGTYNKSITRYEKRDGMLGTTQTSLLKRIKELSSLLEKIASKSEDDQLVAEIFATLEKG